jgi:AraC family transcriptional regulator of adaptative response/methylated-DNA-[protein]-cysteine methyltransferase
LHKKGEHLLRNVNWIKGGDDFEQAIFGHRVVRKDGELGGYRWGLERKRRLLERERGAIL